MPFQGSRHLEHHTARQHTDSRNSKSASEGSAIYQNTNLDYVNPGMVMHLQMAVGNQAAQRVIARRPTVRPNSRSSTTIQRYESGEHIQFGEVESLIAPENTRYTVKASPTTHTVVPEEMPRDIAKRFGVEQELLIARNAALYRTWTSTTGKKIHGFNAGAEIVIPGQSAAEIANHFGVEEKQVIEANSGTIQTWTVPLGGKTIQGFDRGSTVLIPTGRVAVNGKSGTAGAASKTKTVHINGVEFTYGELIAMGDLYDTPDQMYKADPSELRKLKALLVREAAKTGSVSTEEWQEATGGRYLKLAESNVTHFGPSDPSLTPEMKTICVDGPRSSSCTPTTRSGKDHKSEWERYHRQALDKAQSGKKDEALATNAFGDHFLTDAFAAGHLFNKEDVMLRFQQAFSNKKVQEKFFAAVAKVCWADKKVSDLLSVHETVDYKGLVFRPNINSESRFASLLQGIYDDPSGQGVVHNSVAKIVHDHLNKEGVEVQNGKGETWELSGDASLNSKSLEVGQKAVAQSQVNILNTVGSTAALDYASLFKSVWEYVPRPTKTGTEFIEKAIDKFTDPSQGDTVNAAAAIIISEIDAIVDELVNRKKLKKA